MLSQTLAFTTGAFKTMGLDALLAPLGDVPLAIKACLAIAVALEFLGETVGAHTSVHGEACACVSAQPQQPTSVVHLHPSPHTRRPRNVVGL